MIFKDGFKVSLRTELCREYIKRIKPDKEQIKAFVTGFNMCYKSIKKLIKKEK